MAKTRPRGEPPARPRGQGGIWTRPFSLDLRTLAPAGCASPARTRGDAYRDIAGRFGVTKSALSPYLNETLLPRAAKVRARLELAGRIDKGSIDYMMGHRSEGVAARYIHLRPEEALEVLQEYRGALNGALV